MSQINRQPLCELERSQILSRLTPGIISVAKRLGPIEMLLSKPTAEHFNQHRQPTEVICLSGILLAIAVRGGSPQDIARYARNRDYEPLFQGCERAIFDSLLDGVEPDQRETAITAVIELAATIDECMNLLTEEAGITRAVLFEVLFPERTRE